MKNYNKTMSRTELKLKSVYHKLLCTLRTEKNADAYNNKR